MELDIINDLLAYGPKWLQLHKFTRVWAVEYYVDAAWKRAGRGDLILCSKDLQHFLVVEIKRHRKRNQKLLHQMVFYRNNLKMKMPDKLIDCCAVAAGELIAYKADRSTPNTRKTRKTQKTRKTRKTTSTSDRWHMADPPAVDIPCLQIANPQRKCIQ